MDRIFMDEYYEHLRADNIEAFSKERNDEYVGRAEEYKAAKSALLEGLGLEHLFDHSHELTPKEKEIWMLFDRVDVAELLARDAFAKGAYMRFKSSLGRQKAPLQAFFRGLQRFFVPPSPDNFTSVTGRFLYAA
ncbi:MAG: hypothetical protein V8S19_01640 [Gemmiger qucibialis]